MTMRVRRQGAVLAVLWGVTGCGPRENTFSNLQPEVSVLPEAVDFGEVVVNEATQVIEVFLQNSGRADLEAELTVEGEGFVLIGETSFVLEPDATVALPLEFAPTALQTYAGGLAVRSNDNDVPLLVVPLSGVGRVPYAPDIEIVPGDCVSFGAVDVGSSDIEVFEILNVGDADLVLGSVLQRGAGTFSLQTDPSGTRLAPGQRRAVVMGYSPIQPDGDSGTIEIPSNDPDEPSVNVCVEANGGGAFDYPEALIACPGQIDLAAPVLVPLDGTASDDPLGNLPLTYAWSVVRRPLAADPNRTVTVSDQPLTELLIDVAGTWEVTLAVTTSIGTPSVPAKCVIEAIPVDSLHVELSWNGPTSDLDLHLADGDAAFFGIPGDVSWCNRNPDWGVPASQLDDPRLDADDDFGYGPENINIEEPADGTYVVRVHHFDDGVDGSVTANVSVFTFGQLVWSASKVLERNEVWEAGQVNWPDGTFGVFTDPPSDAGGVRECQ